MQMLRWTTQKFTERFDEYENGVNHVLRPSQSPDLNPNETQITKMKNYLLEGQCWKDGVGRSTEAGLVANGGPAPY